MHSGLIDGLLSNCHHQFSWPRRDETGGNYQVCVQCGAKYSYDWAKMRRIALLEDQEGEVPAGRMSMRKCGTKKAWTPRERRLRHCVSVMFRVPGSVPGSIPGSDGWSEGATENVSHSGLLFRSSSPLEVGSSLELILEMPQELTGHDHAKVLCEGSVLRVEAVPATRKNKQSSFLMACTIIQYRFVPSAEQAV